MRRRRAPSELARLARPIATLVDALWRRMHWWIAVMAILYALSGITVVKEGEVGLILRWGKLVPGTHESGLLFAWPRPVDEVVHVDVKHIAELRIDTLANRERSATGDTLDPVAVGYALTGDHNVVHVEMLAHYQIQDPVRWALSGPSAEDALRVEATGAMMQSLGELEVDHVLSDGRKELVSNATRRAQAGLDEAQTGILLTSLELTKLGPPDAVVRDFDAVQSAVIGATTKQKEAQEFAQRAVPQARAISDRVQQEARGSASLAEAKAAGDADAFEKLAAEYRRDSGVERERLYRDAIDRVLAAGSVRWVPPPVGSRYEHLRIPIDPGTAGAPDTSGDNGGGAPVQTKPNDNPGQPTGANEED